MDGSEKNHSVVPLVPYRIKNTSDAGILFDRLDIYKRRNEVDLLFDFGVELVQSIANLETELLKERSNVEAYISQRDLMIRLYEELITNEENDSMDHIALLRTIRLDLEKKTNEWGILKPA